MNVYGVYVCVYAYIYTDRYVLIYIQIFNVILKFYNQFSSPNAILINNLYLIKRNLLKELNPFGL